MTEKRRISWEEYHEATERLAIQIAESNFKVSHVISVARGGLRVGDILSRLFRCKSSYLGVESYVSAAEGQVADKQKEDVIFGRDISSTTKDFGKSIIIADDLVDSGMTLDKSCIWLSNHEYFKGKKDIIFKTAVLYKKPESKFTPDYLVHDLPDNPWLIFPYEESELVTISDLKKKYNK